MSAGSREVMGFGIDVNSWLSEAKREALAKECGMFLIHNGVVRKTAKAQVREGLDSPCVESMELSYDAGAAESFRLKTLEMPGIKIVRLLLNEGKLSVGEDIMYVLIGGDTRPHVVDALNFLVGKLKDECVTEKEVYG